MSVPKTAARVARRMIMVADTDYGIDEEIFDFGRPRRKSADGAIMAL